MIIFTTSALLFISTLLTLSFTGIIQADSFIIELIDFNFVLIFKSNNSKVKTLIGISHKER